MKDFTLAEIAKACNGEYVGDESLKHTKITSVERDSRQVKNGSLFLAIKGERVDGHDFIEKCFAQGAVCALCEKAPENATMPCIVVPSTLYAVLSQKFKTHKTQGNLNNELGVPLTLLSMPEDTEAAVIEMGISDFGEMTRLSEMVQPTICVLTIIGECHLENLGDRDGVLKAKTEMFKNARENADFILNGDDDKLSTVKTVNGKKPVFFGLDAKNDFYAKNIKNSGDGKVLATLCFDNNNIDVEIPAIGTYMVTNALAAAAAGNLLGLTDEEIANGVASYQTVGSRANVINTGKIKIIDDCYNANPTSVRASLDTLSNLDGRKVAILGDMKELGSEELKLHFDTGVYAKSKDIGTVITVGELAKELAKGADGKAFDTIEDAKPEILKTIKSGDVVLVKASHSMQFENIVEFLKQNF